MGSSVRTGILLACIIIKVYALVIAIVSFVILLSVIFLALAIYIQNNQQVRRGHVCVDYDKLSALKIIHNHLPLGSIAFIRGSVSAFSYARGRARSARRPGTIKLPL